MGKLDVIHLSKVSVSADTPLPRVVIPDSVPLPINVQSVNVVFPCMNKLILPSNLMSKKLYLPMLFRVSVLPDAVPESFVGMFVIRI